MDFESIIPNFPIKIILTSKIKENEPQLNWFPVNIIFIRKIERIDFKSIIPDFPVIIVLTAKIEENGLQVIYT